MMRPSSSHHHDKRQLSAPLALTRSSLLERDWQGPTLREFIRQIEHEFGRGLDLSQLRLAGLGRDEPLDPSDIRELCELLGLPPEDFGVA